MIGGTLIDCIQGVFEASRIGTMRIVWLHLNISPSHIHSLYLSEILRFASAHFIESVTLRKCGPQASYAVAHTAFPAVVGTLVQSFSNASADRMQLLPLPPYQIPPKTRFRDDLFTFNALPEVLRESTGPQRLARATNYQAAATSVATTGGFER